MEKDDPNAELDFVQVADDLEEMSDDEWRQVSREALEILKAKAREWRKQAKQGG